MRKLFLVSLVALLGSFGVAASAPDEAILSGLVSATDAEAAEGYFAIGELILVPKTNSDFFWFLLRNRNKKVKFTAISEEVPVAGKIAR